MRPGRVLRNLLPPALVAEALRREEARLSADGALVATTGRFTGRSPKDKYFVAHPELRGRDRLGRRQPAARGASTSPACCAGRVAHVEWRELFAQDLYAGADPAHRLKVRVITEQAWHSLFARNMFIRPPRAELVGFEPDWTVLQLPSLEADPAVDGTNSSTVIAIDVAERLVLIAGTAYAGEIKKAIFTVLNYLLPTAGVLPMHCSANVGADGATAVFFGLSGTGKTTLSADRRPHADRRRRAWLGRGGRLQLRGRLLRQGDPARPRGRAGDLRRLDPIRHRSSRTWSSTRAAAASLRRRQPDREHAQLLPARVHPQRQRHRHAPATRATSSC